MSHEASKDHDRSDFSRSLQGIACTHHLGLAALTIGGDFVPAAARVDDDGAFT
jgi:hypothetical protein